MMGSLDEKKKAYVQFQSALQKASTSVGEGTRREV